jgi:hypothetical protein
LNGEGTSRTETTPGVVDSGTPEEQPLRENISASGLPVAVKKKEGKGKWTIHPNIG